MPAINELPSFNRKISQLFKAACFAELEALKPGNVHVFADGHGMTVHDFINSAEAVSPVIAQPGLSLGQRIFASVHATQKAVACNTNLGIILFCAPLIHAVLTIKTGSLQQRLQQVLQSTTVDDAQFTFNAIALANPAGLGDAAQHDVHRPADCTLLQAMQAAAGRDLIARQYITDFEVIFNLALPMLSQGNSPNPKTVVVKKIPPQNSVKSSNAWLTTKLYLTLLASFPDSHIVRKHGVMIAGDVQRQARKHLAEFDSCENPKTYQRILLDWDKSLKHASINPGTSADLTVAGLFAYALTHLLAGKN